VSEASSPIRYTTARGATLAYQVIGDGPLDLIVAPGLLNHLDAGLDEPGLARWNRRLASFSRLILFDKRGTGMSDALPAGDAPGPEDRADEIEAVLDAVGSERAVVVGLADGGTSAVAFAARRPERTRALVLYFTYARRMNAPDYPLGLDPEEVSALLRQREQVWGRDASAYTALLAPSRANDPGFIAAFARLQRRCATPAAATAMMARMFEDDVRALLPAISTPTLVLRRDATRMNDLESARYLARHIRDARLVSVPGIDALNWVGDVDPLIDAIHEHVVGRGAADSTERLLLTLLFTDIVGSTARAAAVGDQNWRDTLDRHDAVVRQVVERAGGRVVDRTGDGHFAAFENPLRAIEAARGIAAGAAELGLAIRSGLHLGLCERRGDGLAGIAVHLGSRIAALAGANELLATQTLRDALLGSEFAFEEHGRHTLKGVPGEWMLFRVLGSTLAKEST
jgi:class 3 adenylate cyclase